ncbi:hypothetical protein [Carnimonas nigrificans]|nr:hypothetical protein [Carnimonas nigrificans]
MSLVTLAGEVKRKAACGCFRSTAGHYRQVQYNEIMVGIMREGA